MNNGGVTWNELVSGARMFFILCEDLVDCLNRLYYVLGVCLSCMAFCSRGFPEQLITIPTSIPEWVGTQALQLSIWLTFLTQEE